MLHAMSGGSPQSARAEASGEEIYRRHAMSPSLARPCCDRACRSHVLPEPCFVGDEVSLYAHRARPDSMKIEVEAWRRSRDSEETVKVTEAIFTFVAIDDVTRKARPLPEA